MKFIVSNEDFIYDIKIKERRVFDSLILLDLDSFQTRQHKKQFIMSPYSQCIMACHYTFYYRFNKEIKTKRNNYYCTLLKTINSLKMLIIFFNKV